MNNYINGIYCTPSTMKTHTITVRFLCTLCGLSFDQVHLFIGHKIECHFNEFKKIKCILFEEKSYEFFDPPKDPELIDEVAAPSPTNDSSAVETTEEADFKVDVLDTSIHQKGYDRENSANFENSFVRQETREKLKLGLEKYLDGRNSNLRSSSTQIQLTSKNYEADQMDNEETDSYYPDFSDPQEVSDPVNFEVLFNDADTDRVTAHQQDAANQPQNVFSTIGDNVDTYCVELFDDDVNNISSSSTNNESVTVYLNNEIQEFQEDAITSAAIELATVPSTYNPFVLLKRLNSKELASASTAKANKRRRSSAKTSTTDTKLSKRNNCSKKAYFLFPTPTIEDERQCEKTSLTEWLTNQGQGQGSSERSSANIIVLDPDPAKEVVPPVTPKNPIQCKLCCRQLESDPEVRIHVTHCWLKNKLRHRYCVPCKKTFTGPFQLKRHHLAQHASKEEKQLGLRFKCHLCSKAHFTNQLLKEHLKLHEPTSEQGIQKSFRRRLCSRSFGWKTTLKSHLVYKHSQSKPFKCLHFNCLRTFGTQTLLKQHKKRHARGYFTQDQNQPANSVALVDWLKIQNSSSTDMVILLEPDPVTADLGPISPTNPTTCKLCGQKLKTEVEVKVHVTHCWLHNKKRHRYCVPCKRAYANPRSLKNHYLIRHASESEKESGLKYKCQSCPKRFFESKQLKDHLEGHKRKNEKRRPFQCDLCGKFFQSNSKLNSHLARHHHATGPLKCPLPGCSYSYKTPSKLKLHQEKHAMPNSDLNKRVYFTFPQPNFDDQLPLVDWLRIQNSLGNNTILLEPDPLTADLGPITPNNPVTCKLCCKELQTDPEVKVHVTHCWLDNKAKHRYCIPCKKLFAAPAQLKRHSWICFAKADRPRFKCQFCPKDFIESSKLKSHEETHKSKDERIREAVCEICGFATFSNGQLRIHLRSHSDSRPFKCPVPTCTQPICSFKTNHVLQVHMKLLHSSERPFKCEEPDCRMAFKQKLDLQRHTLTHSNSRPRKVFRCTEANCEKVCLHRETLRHHLKRSHNIGPELPVFPCTVCSKSFRTRQNLQDHLVDHTGEWPFKCTESDCTAAFKRKSHFEDHLREHKGEAQPVFECEVCGKVYFRLAALNKHLWTHKITESKEDS